MNKKKFYSVLSAVEQLLWLINNHEERLEKLEKELNISKKKETGK